MLRVARPACPRFCRWDCWTAWCRRESNRRVPRRPSKRYNVVLNDFLFWKNYSNTSRNTFSKTSPWSSTFLHMVPISNVSTTHQLFSRCCNGQSKKNELASDMHRNKCSLNEPWSLHILVKTVLCKVHVVKPDYASENIEMLCVQKQVTPIRWLQLTLGLEHLLKCELLFLSIKCATFRFLIVVNKSTLAPCIYANKVLTKTDLKQVN